MRAAPRRARCGLGCELIRSPPKANQGHLDEGEVIGGELVKSCGDAPALLDLLENRSTKLHVRSR